MGGKVMHMNMLAIEVGLVKSQIKDTEGDLKTKLLAAIKSVKSSGRGGCSGLFMLTEEDQFQIALGATICCVDEEEKERLEWEIRNLASLSAMVSGIPVDINALLSSVEESEFEPLGLLKLWRQEPE